MTAQEKATASRHAVMDMAFALREEGDEANAALFRQMFDCSDEGLAALFDALKSK